MQGAHFHLVLILDYLLKLLTLSIIFSKLTNILTNNSFNFIPIQQKQINP